MSGHTPWPEIKHKRRPLRKVCAGYIGTVCPWHYPGDLDDCPECARATDSPFPRPQMQEIGLGVDALCTFAPFGWKCIRKNGHWGSCAAVPRWYNFRWRWRLRGFGR